jgi:AcrR family transcriptional regulator
MLDSPIRDRQAERRETTRREILAAAWTQARAEGLAAITLRDIAGAVGMKAPSLYFHFDSKAAIYDAMFEQAWTDCRDAMREVRREATGTPRQRLKVKSRAFFEFCVADPARHQLMNTRAVPGFVPSERAYQPAVEAFRDTEDELAEIGITDPAAVDLLTALMTGLIQQQQANDPGGDRWARLLDRAMDMYADNLGLPA